VPVGKNWAQRWVESHENELSMYWSRNLESKRGQAVNPATNTAGWALYKKVVSDNGIVAENLWAADETGFTTGHTG